MPCVGHERGGVQLLRVVPSVPEHDLLRDYRHDRRRKRYRRRHGELLVVTGGYLLHAVETDAEASRQQYHAEYHRRDAFEPVVPVGVILIRRFFRDAHAYVGHERCEHVRQGMHGVGHHGSGVPRDTGVQLEYDKCDIARNADGGQAVDDFGFVH